MSDFQTSQSQQLHKSATLRRVLWVVVVVIIVGAVGTGWYLHNQSAQKQKENLALSAVLLQANNLRAQRQYSNAEQELNSFISTAKQPANRYTAAIELATIYATAGDNTNAIKAYQLAAKNHALNSAITYGEALAADAAGDKTAAIGYYQQSLTLMPNPTITSSMSPQEQAQDSSELLDRQGVSDRITELQGASK